MELTIKDLKELINLKIDLRTIDELIGENVFIRTVTHHYTGHLVSRDSMFIKLEKAAWIADDGRFSDAMKDSSNFSEVEPFVTPPRINLYSIIDICPLTGNLPIEVK